MNVKGGTYKRGEETGAAAAAGHGTDGESYVGEVHPPPFFFATTFSGLFFLSSTATTTVYVSPQTRSCACWPREPFER